MHRAASWAAEGHSHRAAAWAAVGLHHGAFSPSRREELPADGVVTLFLRVPKRVSNHRHRDPTQSAE